MDPFEAKCLNKKCLQYEHWKVNSGCNRPDIRECKEYVKYLEEEEEGNEVLDLTLDDVLDDLVKVREYFGEEWNCYYHPIYHRYFYRGKKSGRYFYFTDTGEVVYLK